MMIRPVRYITTSKARRPWVPSPPGTGPTRISRDGTAVRLVHRAAVIPNSWTSVRRPADDEPVGYLAPDGDRVVPTTLVGTPLDGPMPRDEARAVLLARGLRALDRRWWCRLPDPLPRGGTVDAADLRDGWDWRPVLVVEAAPDGVRVRPEWAAPEELSGRAALPVPVGDLLREDPPAT
jgi:hypothetical protein